MNYFLLPKAAHAAASEEGGGKPHIVLDKRMVVLGLAFAATWTVVAAMAVHARLLEAAGATPVQAIAAGALIGPSQVAARILEASLLKRFHPMVFGTHRRGAASDRCRRAGAVWRTCCLRPVHDPARRRQRHLLTIARGTVPLAMFGPENYGYRLGLLGAPSRIAMAAAPVVFGVLIERYGAGVLIVSSALNMAALLGLCMLSITPPSSAPR